jgi:hypothetical protein
MTNNTPATKRNYVMPIAETETIKKRLKAEETQCGSLRKVARNHGVNQRYVWEFIKRGVEPTSEDIRRALGFEPRKVVTIYVVGGDIPPDCMVLGDYRVCACGRKFAPNSPKRKQCYKCEKVRKRKL